MGFNLTRNSANASELNEARQWPGTTVLCSLMNCRSDLLPVDVHATQRGRQHIGSYVLGTKLAFVLRDDCTLRFRKSAMMHLPSQCLHELHLGILYCFRQQRNHLRHIVILVIIVAIQAPRMRSNRVPPVEQVWLISTRCAPRYGNLESGLEKITYQRLDEEDGSASLAAFRCGCLRASGDPSIPITVFIHGNATGSDRPCGKAGRSTRACGTSPPAVPSAWLFGRGRPTELCAASGPTCSSKSRTAIRRVTILREHCRA